MFLWYNFSGIGLVLDAPPLLQVHVIAHDSYFLFSCRSWPAAAASVLSLVHWTLTSLHQYTGIDIITSL